VSAAAIAAGITEFFDQDPSALRANIAALREELSWHRFAEGLVDFVSELS
jgi:hypothetical protein